MSAMSTTLVFQFPGSTDTEVEKSSKSLDMKLAMVAECEQDAEAGVLGLPVVDVGARLDMSLFAHVSRCI